MSLSQRSLSRTDAIDRNGYESRLFLLSSPRSWFVKLASSSSPEISNILKIPLQWVSIEQASNADIIILNCLHTFRFIPSLPLVHVIADRQNHYRHAKEMGNRLSVYLTFY